MLINRTQTSYNQPQIPYPNKDTHKSRDRHIDITNYETLLKAAHQQSEPQRFLCVFAKKSLPDDHSKVEATRYDSGSGGSLEPIMCVCVDKPLDGLSNFAGLVKESQRIIP